MTSEWDDFDNARIADRVMDHSKFSSESEDMDNQRRCNYAGVPYPGVPYPTNHSANTTKNTYPTDHIPVTDPRHPLHSCMNTNN